MVRIKTFFEALSFYYTDSKKFLRYFEDKRLSQAEKAILRSWQNLREVKLQVIIKDLSGLKNLETDVEAQRQLLLGIAYNNTGDLLHAVTHLLRSLELLQEVGPAQSMFAATNTLFITYQNLKDHEGMARVLDEMEELENPTQGQQLEILRRRFAFLCFVGKLDKAQATMKKIESFEKHFSDSQKINVLMDKFDLAIKSENYKDCEKLLDKMKGHRNFHLSINFKFMRKTLDLINKGDPLYLYAKDFSDNPMMYAQVKVLLLMEQTNFEGARREWLNLHKLSPQVYDKDFGYHGDKCLFSLSVKKLQPKKQVIFAQKGEMNNEQLFLKIMTEHQGVPISKEELFFQLWGRELETKEDLNKLVCTVYRLKNKYKLIIKSKKGCYILQSVGKKAA